MKVISLQKKVSDLEDKVVSIFFFKTLTPFLINV